MKRNFKIVLSILMVFALLFTTVGVAEVHAYSKSTKSDADKAIDDTLSNGKDTIKSGKKTESWKDKLNFMKQYKKLHTNAINRLDKLLNKIHTELTGTR